MILSHREDVRLSIDAAAESVELFESEAVVEPCRRVVFALSYSNFAAALLRAERWNESSVYSRKAIAIYLEFSDRTSPVVALRLAIAYEAWGAASYGNGQFAEALAAFVDALEILEHLYRSSPSTCDLRVGSVRARIGYALRSLNSDVSSDLLARLIGLSDRMSHS
jgi:tetratricopeptide (TPR) repeat protein